MSNKLRNYKPLGEVVFEDLKKAILDGELKAGQRLMETAIAEKLGVSRTPVREAIRKLEKEKFVKMIPRKGAYVTELTLDDMMEVLEIRVVLEGLSAKLAARKIDEKSKEKLKDNVEKFKKALNQMDRKALVKLDDEFHNIIYEATDNDKLIEMISDLHDQFQRFRLTYFTEFNEYLDSQTFHVDIYESIIEGKPILAEEKAKKHIEDLRKSLVRWKEEGRRDD